MLKYYISSRECPCIRPWIVWLHVFLQAELLLSLREFLILTKSSNSLITSFMISKSLVLLLSILLSLDCRNLLFLLCPHREMTLYRPTFKNFESSYRLQSETTKKEVLCNLISQKSRKLHPWYNFGKTAFENTLAITVPQDLQEIKVALTVAFTIIFLVHHWHQWLYQRHNLLPTLLQTLSAVRESAMISDFPTTL